MSRLGIRSQIGKIQNDGFHMADQNFVNYLDSPEIHYSWIFGVADYEYDLSLQKFKMADPI